MIGIIIIQPKWKKLKSFNNILGKDKLIPIEFDQIKKYKYDFIVQNGLKKPGRQNIHIYEYAENIYKEKNIPTLIREAPVLRKISNGASSSSLEKISFEDKWIKLSWNSYYIDEGLFPYDPSYDRWSELSKKYNINIENWQRRGDAVLLNLQKGGDSALNRLTYNGINYIDYIIEKIKQIQLITDRPLIIRSHPLDRIIEPYLQRIFPNIEYSKNQNLYDDLDRAWCMITYNSTSCVESTLYGTPTIVLDPSAVSTPVSQTNLEQIEESWDADRSEWCKKIAFHQWQGKELTDGYVWNLLKQTAKLK